MPLCKRREWELVGIGPVFVAFRVSETDCLNTRNPTHRALFYVDTVLGLVGK
jgi:hypothetical protein